ncbi:MAG: VOC family protein [Rhodospirillaceae bacterium]|nr:VOC family protein [Rhodospirillaceae bacterium]
MASNKSNLIGGLYEIAVGVSDLEQALAFWRAFGYVPGPRGRLEAAASTELYGVTSALESVRLHHGKATHGLIRLLRWDMPVGTGLGHAPLRSTGSRWSVHKTDDIMNGFNHAETARQQGQDIQLRGPLINVRSTARGYKQKPFFGPIRASHNFQMTLPEARIVTMQRFNIDISRYGTVAADALMRTSEGCHMGLVVTGEDISLFDFYDDVLGFRRGKKVHIEYEPGYTPSDFFDLAPGEHFTEFDLEDPASGETPETQLPGRLRVFMIHNAQTQPDLREQSRPGHLGYCLYTARMNDLIATRAAVMAYRKHGGAKNVTAIQSDEFGTAAFSFSAPDGYAWTLLQA